MAAASSARDADSIMTPDSKTPGRITFHVPTPAKTGNKARDDNAVTDQLNLQSIFQDLIDIPELRKSVYNHIQKEKKTLAAKTSFSKQAETFEELTTLQGLDESYKITFLAAQSDMNTKELLEAVKEDREAVNDILCYGVQLPMKAKLPNQLIVKAVMSEFLRKRMQVCGDRLSKFKASGGITDSHKVSFAKPVGSYELVFDPKDKVLVQIRHRSGDTAEVAKTLSITPSYVLQDNYDDMIAHLSLPPLPIIKLCAFFSSRQKTGPFSIAGYHGKPKDLLKLAQDTYDTWEIEQNKILQMKDQAETVVAAVKEQKASKQRANMKRAREGAEKALAKQKARRSIPCNV